MKKHSILPVFILFVVMAEAQHCPWDCGGMIIVETPALKERVYDLNPRLADENKRAIIDTIYGTGKDTYDACQLLFYNDFIANRKKKVKLHHFYAYDTAYSFAENRYVIKYNYCLYKHQKLYIMFIDPYRRDLYYHYIEVPDDKRIHLHDFSTEIRENINSPELKENIEPYVMHIPCLEWGLYQETDCR